LSLTRFQLKALRHQNKAAIKATVNSGRDVEKAIKLKPIAVFPSRVIVANLIALLIAEVGCPV